MCYITYKTTKQVEYKLIVKKLSFGVFLFTQLIVFTFLKPVLKIQGM